MALKSIVLLVLVLGCGLLASGATAAPARELSVNINIKPGHNLTARLDEAGGGGGLVECWNALNELKSCTNEIVLYFMNGQTELGPDCCRAIEIITRHCWPAMLPSLGFTPEEGDILRGYCDASSGPAAAAAAAAPLAAASPLSVGRFLG